MMGLMVRMRNLTRGTILRGANCRELIGGFLPILYPSLLSMATDYIQHLRAVKLKHSNNKISNPSTINFPTTSKAQTAALDE